MKTRIYAAPVVKELNKYKKVTNNSAAEWFENVFYSY